MFMYETNVSDCYAISLEQNKSGSYVLTDVYDYSTMNFIMSKEIIIKGFSHSYNVRYKKWW